MHQPEIAVAHPADAAMREAYGRALGGRAALRWLHDLDAAERSTVLGSAEVLATFVPQRELQAGEIARLAKLRFVQSLAAGLDRFPLHAFAPGVLIASNAGAAAGPVAEHALAMILAAAKQLPLQHRKLAAGAFDQTTLSRRIGGASAVIVGFGAIGRRIGHLLAALGMEVDVINRSGRTEAPVRSAGTLADLARVLPGADVVVLAASLNEATFEAITRRELAWMKSDAILVNVSRAHLVREADLFAHLAAHPKFWACLDAWWVEPLSHGRFETNFPFLELPNVIGSPHNSPAVPGIFIDLVENAAANVARFLDGSRPENLLSDRDRFREQRPEEGSSAAPA
jgi:glycerate dehydrogenase